MSWFPWFLAAVGPLAGAAISAYYRWKWLTTASALKALTDVRAEWSATNAALQARLERTEAALIERHNKERAEDAATRERVAGDPAGVVDLLHGLHQGGPRTDPGPGPDLQPSGGTGLSGSTGDSKMHD